MKPDLKKLRSAQVSAYRLDNDYGECQVSHLLRLSTEFREWSRKHSLPGLEVDHIYGRGRVEHEDWTNLILIERAAHHWKHDAGGLSFSVCHAVEACELLAKWRLHEECRQRVEAWTESDSENFSRYHWHRPTLELICGYSTFANRVEMLSDSLANSVFAGVVQELSAIIA